MTLKLNKFVCILILGLFVINCSIKSKEKRMYYLFSNYGSNENEFKKYKLNSTKTNISTKGKDTTSLFKILVSFLVFFDSAVNAQCVGGTVNECLNAGDCCGCLTTSQSNYVGCINSGQSCLASFPVACLLGCNCITKNPTSFPTLIPTFFPSQSPTLSPSINPTLLPTSNPSLFPSLSPTLFPTNNPSFTPTFNPSYITFSPTITPTSTPSSSPTEDPSIAPSFFPTTYLSISPTITSTSTSTSSSSPTKESSISPSHLPTTNQSISPTIISTSIPSLIPTDDLSIAPSLFPSISPTEVPTNSPSISPSPFPTINPSLSPIYTPTINPSSFPSLFHLGPTRIPNSFPTIFSYYNTSKFVSPYVSTITTKNINKLYINPKILISVFGISALASCICLFVLIKIFNAYRDNRVKKIELATYNSNIIDNENAMEEKISELKSIHSNESEIDKEITRRMEEEHRKFKKENNKSLYLNTNYLMPYLKYGENGDEKIEDELNKELKILKKRNRTLLGKFGIFYDKSQNEFYIQSDDKEKIKIDRGSNNNIKKITKTKTTTTTTTTTTTVTVNMKDSDNKTTVATSLIDTDNKQDLHDVIDKTDLNTIYEDSITAYNNDTLIEKDFDDLFDIENEY